MNTRKSNGLVKILLSILCLILGGLVGYVAFNKECPETKTTCPKCEEITEDGKEKENNKQISSVTQIKTFTFPSKSVALLYDGEVYVNVYGSTSNIDGVYGIGTYQNLVNTRNNYKKYSFNNFTFMDDENNEFKGIKLNISNVKTIYENVFGQALSSTESDKYGIIFLKEDNTVSGISFKSLINGKTDVTIFTELTNIEKIVSTNLDGYETKAIDKDGNEYKINDYISKISNW